MTSYSRNQQGQQRKTYAPRPELPKVPAIKEVVNKGHLLSFLRELLPAGKLNGSEHSISAEYRVGDINNTTGKAKNHGGTLVFTLNGNNAGLGYDFAPRQSCDIVDVVMARKNLTLAQALAWIRHRIDMPIDVINSYEPAPKTPEELAAAAAKIEKSIASARRLWDTTEDIEGTDAEAYLRHRGIRRTLPASLRFRPKLEYWTQNDDGNPVIQARFPALVCMIQRADGSFCGVHRIYLQERTDPTTGEVFIGKADVAKPKKVWGDPLGGAVRCCDDEDVRGSVGITEGIENALSVPELYEGFPCWAAVSASGVAAIELPDWISRPTFFPDNDPPQKKPDGSLRLNRDGKPIYPGLDAANEAVARLKGQGKIPTITPVRGGKDTNAVLLAECSKAD